MQERGYSYEGNDPMTKPEKIYKILLPLHPNLDLLSLTDRRDFKAMQYLVRKNRKRYRGYWNILRSYPLRIVEMYNESKTIPRFIKYKA